MAQLGVMEEEGLFPDGVHSLSLKTVLSLWTWLECYQEAIFNSLGNWRVNGSLIFMVLLLFFLGAIRMGDTTQSLKSEAE